LSACAPSPSRPNGETGTWPGSTRAAPGARYTHRDALTSSDVHQAVSYRPITRYQVAGGHLNLRGLTVHDPSAQLSDIPEEQS
jgi:hypothetical protein